MAWLQTKDSYGKVVLIKDRHIPTIDYFLRIWIPKQGKPTICRTTYYNWLNCSNEVKLNTIKRIEGLFVSLAIDIVANEGKGIFYAKNKLGMTDKPKSLNLNWHNNCYLSINIKILLNEKPTE